MNRTLRTSCRLSKTHRRLLKTLGVAAIGSVVVGVAVAQTTRSAAGRAGEANVVAVAGAVASPENQALAARVGLWDVVETGWKTPDAAPATVVGLVAERRMIGEYLQETIRKTDDPHDAKRVDYLRYNHVSAQWEYVSMDTRIDVGMMPAKSFTTADADGKIVLVHEPFAMPGGKPGDGPTMLRMDTTIARPDADHDQKDQHFVATDGTGRVWLAHQYRYARRR